LLILHKRRIIMNLDEITYIVIGVCVIVVALLVVSILQMRSNRLKPRDWIEHPLGIPTGSVRALLALIIVLITVWVAISGKVKIAEDMPKWLLAIVGAVIGFYFGNRGIGIEKKRETIEDSLVIRLNRLRALRDRGAIKQEEFEKELDNIMHSYSDFTRDLASVGRQPKD
jgi:small-conductance mechanosensitive channel